MTPSQKLFWTFTPAAAVVALGCVLVQVASDSVSDTGRLILFPGLLLDAMLSGNPHRGLASVLGWVVMIGGSVAGWALVSYLLLCIIQPLARAIPHHRQ